MPQSTWSCAQCSISFDKSKLLERHALQSAHKAYRCSKCPKSFGKRTALIRHNITHSDNKSHACRVCKKAFYRKDHCLEHEEVCTHRLAQETKARLSASLTEPAQKGSAVTPDAVTTASPSITVGQRHESLVNASVSRPSEERGHETDVNESASTQDPTRTERAAVGANSSQEALYVHQQDKQLAPLAGQRAAASWKSDDQIPHFPPHMLAEQQEKQKVTLRLDEQRRALQAEARDASPQQNVAPQTQQTRWTSEMAPPPPATSFLPAALLAQYPALANIRWDELPQGPDPTTNDLSGDAYDDAYDDVYRSSYDDAYDEGIDATPDFPAHIVSMESSVREQPTGSSIGTYACTYHGCTQRFDSPENLQAHKRDFHRTPWSGPKSSENVPGLMRPPEINIEPATQPRAALDGNTMLSNQQNIPKLPALRTSQHNGQPVAGDLSRVAESSAPSIWARTPKVLLVEDDQTCRRIVSKFLYNFDCQVVTAVDGFEAVNLANKDATFDLILMNVIMPKLDGMTATHLIRQYSPVPITFMTANLRTEDISIYLRHGVSDVLPKPFTKYDLSTLIQKHLQHLIKTDKPMASNNVGHIPPP